MDQSSTKCNTTKYNSLLELCILKKKKNFHNKLCSIHKSVISCLYFVSQENCKYSKTSFEWHPISINKAPFTQAGA